MRPSTSRPSVDRLRSSLDQLPRMVASLPGDVANATGEAGDWSVREVMGHLADAEQVYGVRMRMIVTADRPPLVSYDQDEWAARFTALETTEQAMSRWQVLREANLRLLDSISEDEWKRSGRHDERGDESVERIADLLAEHDENHLEQMRRAASR